MVSSTIIGRLEAWLGQLATVLYYIIDTTEDGEGRGTRSTAPEMATSSGKEKSTLFLL